MLSLFVQIRQNQNNSLETNYLHINADDIDIARTLQILRIKRKRNKSWELKYNWLKVNIVNDDNYRGT